MVVHAMEILVTAFKRVELQNIMVTVVKGLEVIHALEIHVRMMVLVKHQP